MINEVFKLFFFPKKKTFLFFDNTYCGAKEFNSIGPLHTEPKAHAEEKEAPED